MQAYRRPGPTLIDSIGPIDILFNLDDREALPRQEISLAPRVGGRIMMKPCHEIHDALVGRIASRRRYEGCKHRSQEYYFFHFDHRYIGSIIVRAARIQGAPDQNAPWVIMDPTITKLNQ